MHVWRGWRPALWIFSSYGRDAWLTVLLGDHTHTHTTSVSRLISPPSPIPVVSLPVMFFFPILITLATICSLHPLWYYLCLSLFRFPSNHMHLHSAWSLSDSPFSSQPRFPPCSLSSSLTLPPFSPPLWLRVRLKLIVHLLSVFALVPLPLILCRCLFLGWATLLCLAWECWVLCAVRLQGQRMILYMYEQKAKTAGISIPLHGNIIKLHPYSVFDILYDCFTSACFINPCRILLHVREIPGFEPV